MQTDTTAISIEDLVATIEKGNVIPIIGFDLFNAVFENQPNDLLTFLVEAYDKELCDQVRQQIKVENGFDLVNGVYHSLKRPQRNIFGKAISSRPASRLHFLSCGTAG